MARVCAVVGAGPGVGLAVARRFGREGFIAALVARRAEALEGYTTALAQDDVVTYGFAGDAGDGDSLRGAFAQIATQVGAPDVLVYNAARVHSGVPSALSEDEALEDFRINVVGALVAAQAVIPHMRAVQRGTILITGGGLALYPSPQYASLALGKAALRSLAFTLGAELEADGIHVATVTIAGSVQPGTYFDPDRIAEVYWGLHQQPREAWEREVLYKSP
jgi:NAD(P)-dependent dehydrogenase (short-subunit alcohol dehydrogenase family)